MEYSKNELERMVKYSNAYLSTIGIFNAPKRQQYFFVLIFMSVAIYFVYSIVYIPLKNKYRFWTFSGKNANSPELICKKEKNEKCNMDGQHGAFDANKAIYNFTHEHNADKIKLFDIDRGPAKLSYSMLIYLDYVNDELETETPSQPNNIFNLSKSSSVLDENSIIKVSHINPNIKIQIANKSINVPIITNRWFHLVISYDDDIVDIYINGELHTSQIIEKEHRIQANNPNKIVVGRFGGKIMKVRYFKYNMSPLDVLLLYQYYKYINILDSGNISGSPGSTRICETFKEKKGVGSGTDVNTRSPSDLFDTSQKRLKMKEYYEVRDKRGKMEKMEKEYTNMIGELFS